MSEPIENIAGAPPRIKVGAVVVVLAGGFALIAGGVVAFVLLSQHAPPPPPEVAADPLLSAGRAVFLDRCVSCHGASGKGDGPIAKGLAGPPVGDLTDRTWKHGDRPEQVEAVVAEGVKNTAMPGWNRTLGPDKQRAVTAYVYYLAGRDVPSALRVVNAPGANRP